MQQGIKEKDIRDFEKYCEKLNTVIKRIRSYNPAACAYISDNTMNLMSGAPHEGGGESHQERSVTCILMPHFDGGGW